MIGISCIADAVAVAAGARAFASRRRLAASPPAFSRAICSAKRWRAISSMPKVAHQLAQDVVGRQVAVLELLEVAA